MIEAYPLQWPPGWPRTAFTYQHYGEFGTQDKANGGCRHLLNPARPAPQSSPMHPFDACWGYFPAPMLHAPSTQDAGPAEQETPLSNKFAALFAVPCLLRTAIRAQKVLTRDSSFSPTGKSSRVRSSSNIAPASTSTRRPDRAGVGDAVMTELNVAMNEAQKEIGHA
jgi:hypothetical protein